MNFWTKMIVAQIVISTGLIITFSANGNIPIYLSGLFNGCGTGILISLLIDYLKKEKVEETK